MSEGAVHRLPWVPYTGTYGYRAQTQVPSAGIVGTTCTCDGHTVRDPLHTPRLHAARDGTHVDM